MAFNPDDPNQLQSLGEALEASRKNLAPFRKVFTQAIEQTVGVFYSENGAEKPIPLNLMELAANIYQRQLFAKPPQVSVFTRDMRIRPAGVKLESVVNRRLLDPDIQDSFNSVILCAIFGIGLMKVGVKRDDQDFEYDGFMIPGAEPYLEPILLDDWVQDMSARHPSEFHYLGNRYRLPLEDVLDNPRYDQKAKDHVQASEMLGKNETGEGRVSQIQGPYKPEGEFGKATELWDICLPRERLVVTLTSDYKHVLEIVEVQGRPMGPFYWLGFEDVPGNTMPLSPGMLWQGLHRTVNGLMRKLERQAERQKTVSVCRGPDSEDAERLRTASDGSTVGVNDPNSLTEKMFGGIDQKNFAFMLQCKDLFSWQVGNLDVLGGLGAGSDTLGQDKILNENASQRIAGMQERVRLFTKAVLSAFAYHIWSDPYQSYEAEVQVEGYGPIPSVLTPEDRSHDFYRHELIIEPYSMIYQTPSARISIIHNLLDRLAPLLPMMQEQGLQINIQQLIALYAKYQNIPELVDLITTGSTPIDLGGGKGTTEVRQSPVTTRRQERISRPGPSTRQGADANMIQQLMGGWVQGAERAGVPA